MTGNGWSGSKWLERPGNAENAKNGWKWLEWLDMAGNGWKWLEIAGNECFCPKYDWTSPKYDWIKKKYQICLKYDCVCPNMTDFVINMT